MFYARCGDIQIGPFTTYAAACFAAEAELGPIFVIIEKTDEEDLAAAA